MKQRSIITVAVAILSCCCCGTVDEFSANLKNMEDAGKRHEDAVQKVKEAKKEVERVQEQERRRGQ